MFYCQNEATVKITHKGRSKSLSIMKLKNETIDLFSSAKFNFCIYSKHLPGKTKLIADALSRVQMVNFRRLAPDADSRFQSFPPWRKFFGNFQ